MNVNANLIGVAIQVIVRFIIYIAVMWAGATMVFIMLAPMISDLIESGIILFGFILFALLTFIFYVVYPVFATNEEE